MSDFYQMASDEQAVALTHLARCALVQWGIKSDAEINLIKHRENAVFCVSHDGERFALRVHRANYHSDEALKSELLWIAAINSEELRTPQVIPTQVGKSFAKIKVDEVPEERQVDLLEWFEGQPIATVEEGVTDVLNVKETFLTVGRLMATTHNHSEAWQRPEGFIRHAWDEEGILGAEPFWGRYWELAGLTLEQRGRLEQAKAKALAELSHFGKDPKRYGLIHADFLAENLLQKGDNICLIDFDDAGFGWHLFDIVTTLFFHLGENYFDEASAALLEGYVSVRALPEADLEHLPLFFLLRGFTYLGWAHTRSETDTAREMTPMIIAAVDEMAMDYLSTGLSTFKGAESNE